MAKAYFYGEVQGDTQPVHRLGREGMKLIGASWQGAVYVRLWEEEDGAVMCQVLLGQWYGEGARPEKILYEGPVAGT